MKLEGMTEQNYEILNKDSVFSWLNRPASYISDEAVSCSIDACLLKSTLMGFVNRTLKKEDYHFLKRQERLTHREARRFYDRYHSALAVAS